MSFIFYLWWATVGIRAGLKVGGARLKVGACLEVVWGWSWSAGCGWGSTWSIGLVLGLGIYLGWG